MGGKKRSGHEQLSDCWEGPEGRLGEEHRSGKAVIKSSVGNTE